MESPEQFLGLSDHSRVIKRRRRAHRLRRLCSPSSSPTTVASSSSSAGGDCSILEVAGQDEDMANCLILLASGDGPAASGDRENTGEESGSGKSESSIVRSKKASEVSVVYECKTCNRVFPSFQALGGHRASHSKPNKGIGTLDDRNRTKEPDQDRSRIDRNTLSLNPAPEISIVARPGKVHECLICGSEFASGQALGGHMRRHRSTGDDDAAGASIRSDEVNRKPRKLMTLDLNLPAPEEDDDGDSLFGCGPGQPVQPLFISASALVDCYY